MSPENIWLINQTHDLREYIQISTTSLQLNYIANNAKNM